MKGDIMGNAARMWRQRLCTITFALTALAIAWSAAPVSASSFLSLGAPKSESPWAEVYNAKLRLITSAYIAPSGQPAHLVGVEVALSPGWKTYWRNPGDAGGVPPSFDFAGSTNLAASTVLFPAPIRMVEEYGTSVGYKKRVVFPITITPERLEDPVRLRVSLYLGVCEAICVPVETKLDLTLAGGAERTTAHLPTLMAALDAIPRRDDGSSPAKRYEVQVIDNDLAAPDPRLAIAVGPGPNGHPARDLFLEATDDTHVPIPAPGKAASNGRMIFSVPLTPDTAKALEGTTLRLTITGDAGPSEHLFSLGSS